MNSGGKLILNQSLHHFGSMLFNEKKFNRLMLSRKALHSEAKWTNPSGVKTEENKKKEGCTQL